MIGPLLELACEVGSPAGGRRPARAAVAPRVSMNPAWPWMCMRRAARPRPKPAALADLPFPERGRSHVPGCSVLRHRSPGLDRPFSGPGGRPRTADRPGAGGQQPPGTWLLTYLGAAREVISPERAQAINNALVKSLDAAFVVTTAASTPCFADLVHPVPASPIT